MCLGLVDGAVLDLIVLSWWFNFETLIIYMSGTRVLLGVISTPPCLERPSVLPC